ncbi:hypothetical protein IB642_03720 [Allofrancisella guangzhouensis]|uniref:Uncharacterized protein n=1 Tax=Allofrancisella guangzhouensis TaxID=594679 RepID=A0A0A8E628_9GAMM|nr:hypothetical protein [Allofrancisella guangzhouensis]AJC49042.1 hypothetical protein SD28_05050 [Allofrancisella guangzhouensis]MBK2027468.1 hypothetical protein [Allofrancisella guangzhouensis]MBK2044127.1 hypothetical protein [Allofrancisella guangzhouensis]MBK2045444.1 hypothetical protein [Allofrancisella guangzhouensis]
MNKKGLFLFFSLGVLITIAVLLFYKFAIWYEQALGSIFSYIVMVSFVLLVFSPFRFIKDNKANISVSSYIKYLGYTLLYILKFIASVAKQVILTILYLISKLFSTKNKEPS